MTAQATADFIAKKKEEKENLAILCDIFRESWRELLTEHYLPSDRMLIPWITRYGGYEVDEAILIAAAPYNRGELGQNEDEAFERLLPYIGGVLRNRERNRRREE